MPQASAIWDNEILGCPFDDGYAMTQASVHRTGSPIEGTARYRRVQQEGLLNLEVRIPQTLEQYQSFRSFYYLDLKGGLNWFTMPLLIGLTWTNLVCHIQDGFKVERNKTVHGQYITTFSMEAFRNENTPYELPTADIIDATGPDNPDLDTLDVIDATGPDNPSLGSLDVIYGGSQVGLP